MGDVLNDHILTQVNGEYELEEQLVDELQVRPGFLKVRFILIWVHISRLLVVYIT